MNYAMYSLLNELKRQSLCHDKQVACIITDKKDNILSVGINTVENCAHCNVGEKTKHCLTKHAEMAAIECLPDRYEMFISRRAYLSLYPCPDCQRALDNYVEEIIVFNNKHKECVIKEDRIKVVGDLAMDLVNVNGVQKQVSVIMGELGELITVMSDYFYRRHERTVTPNSLMSEVIDVELMTQCLLSILKEDTSGILVDYNQLKKAKLYRIVHELYTGGIRGGSPFTNPLPDKEMN